MSTTPVRRRLGFSLAAVVAAVVAVLVLVLAAPRPAAPQEQSAGPGFRNLQVLPSDISRKELMDVMRFDFVGGLGVRCSHCHVGEEGRPLTEYDFPSDDRPSKRKAREMMRMVAAINDVHLAGLGERADPPVLVGCVTCHRGQPEPRTIQEELHLTLVEEGLDATIERFRELRAEYFGRHTYDFGPTALTTFTRTLSDEGRRAEAIRFLELNVELHPDYWYSHVLLSRLLAEDDPARARREMERALGLAPEDSVPWVRMALDELLTEAGEEGSASAAD